MCHSGFCFLFFKALNLDFKKKTPNVKKKDIICDSKEVFARSCVTWNAGERWRLVAAAVVGGGEKMNICDVFITAGNTPICQPHFPVGDLCHRRISKSV